MRVRLGVFAKHWTPGQAKTRLAATLGDERAAEAARLFVETTIDRLAAIEAEHAIAYTPADREAEFAGLVEGTSWRIAAQPDGSLGDRMRRFFERCYAEGAQIVLIVGADCPDLPLAVVRRAIAWLSQEGPAERAVLAPTDDGGYWMVGGRGAAPPIFDRVPWGTPEVWGVTQQRLADHGWRRGQDYEAVDRWYDVDTGDDLAALRSRLATADAADGPLNRLARGLSALLAD